MQSTPWINLLRRLPPEQHYHLVVVTAGGVEISLQNILMLEGDCLVFKGRLSGSQDAGRLFYVPYDRIDYLGFSRAVTEEEFRAWYGDLSAAAPAEANGKIADTAPSANGAGTGSGSRPVLPNRAALLERIRARPTMHGGTQPEDNSSRG